MCYQFDYHKAFENHPNHRRLSTSVVAGEVVASVRLRLSSSSTPTLGAAWVLLYSGFSVGAETDLFDTSRVIGRGAAVVVVADDECNH